MGPTVVIKTDPVADHPRGVLLGFEAVPVKALLFQRPDDSLDHAVRAAIVALRSKDHSIRDIAKQLRVGTGTVYKVLEAA